jgi:hypothetical protein
MNCSGFLLGMSGNGFRTGSLLAYYDLTVPESLLYPNLKFDPSFSFVEAGEDALEDNSDDVITDISGDAIEVAAAFYINLDAVPGVILGTIPNISGQMSVQIGRDLELQNLHCLFDFDFNACSNTGATEATILLTSRREHNDTSGFVFGINSSNRLFFENNGKIRTLNQELRDKNIIGLSIAQNQYVNFGVFDFTTNSFVSESLTNPLSKSLDDLFLISYPSGDHSVYSGAMGNLNHFAILDDVILDRYDLALSLFCTNASTIAYTTTGRLISVNGVTGVNIYESGVTGFQTFTGAILKEDSTTVTGIYTLGVSGLILTDTRILPIVITGGAVTFTSYSSVLGYNQSEIKGYSRFDGIFGNDLNGSQVEVYYYDKFQPYKNINLSNFILPNVGNSLHPNLYVNGLLASSGVDYDVEDGEILVFNDNSLVETLTVSYSVNPAISMYYTGQFPVDGGGGIWVSASGVLVENQDVYLNGQKLVRGIDFEHGVSGTLFNSGVLETGCEIVFIAMDDIPIQQVAQYNSTSYLVTGIWGFSEQIWLNGVLQTRGEDYYLVQPCTPPEYFFSANNTQLVYNNDGYYLNFVDFPFLTDINGDIIYDGDGFPITV